MKALDDIEASWTRVTTMDDHGTPEYAEAVDESVRDVPQLVKALRAVLKLSDEIETVQKVNLERVLTKTGQLESVPCGASDIRNAIQSALNLYECRPCGRCGGRP